MTAATVTMELAAGEAVVLLRRVRGRPPAEAEAQLHELAQRLAPLTLHLVPERNHYSGQLDHGLVIRAPGETAYVTCRGVEATPWLLHQVHDFRESILLSVDGETMSVGEAVAALDEVLEHASLRERMIDSCIINRQLKQRQYPVSDEELQAEVNQLRRRRGLLSAAETERWMRAHGMSHARLEKMAATTVRVRRLRHELCAAAVEGYFEGHRDELARAALIRLRFANAAEAQRARARATSRESFFAVADELVANDLRQGAPVARLDTLVVTRHELDPPFGAEVFERPGVVVGPQVTPDGAYLAYVSSIEPARQLDGDLRQLIERQLFATWLREERERASVEWNWGHEG